MSHAPSHTKLALWKQRFDRFSTTKQTVQSFCDDVGCSTPTYYYWKQKLEAEHRAESARARTKPSAFVPVIVRGGTTLPVVVRLTDGTRVSVPVDALAALDVVLQHAQRAAQ